LISVNNTHQKKQPEKQKLSDVRGGTARAISADKSGIVVGCGQGALRVLELQREGGKRLPAEAFLMGFPLQAGAKFE
jgi:methionyl-tRNA formyltransferase